MGMMGVVKLCTSNKYITYNCIAGEFGGLVICAAWATATIQHVCIDIIAAMVIIWDPIAKLNSC